MELTKWRKMLIVIVCFECIQTSPVQNSQNDGAYDGINKVKKDCWLSLSALNASKLLPFSDGFSRNFSTWTHVNPVCGSRSKSKWWLLPQCSVEARSTAWNAWTKNASVWFFGTWWISLVFQSFMFHKVVQRHTLGMVECLHSAYSKFPPESVSERIFKLG